MKNISIYVKNKYYSPASFYRIVQYFDGLNNVTFHTQLNDSEYKKYMPISKQKLAVKLYIYMKILFTVIIDLFHDCFNKIDYIVISRSLVQRHMPYVFMFVLYILKIKKVKIIWDFDDQIIDSKEISKKSFIFFCKLSDTIVLTNHFLKSLIPDTYKKKVIILPTTDGQIYKYCTPYIQNERNIMFNKKINLVWVGTSGNLKYLYRIIPALDNAAKKISMHNKQLFLYVVCDVPLLSYTNSLKIINTIWSREIAANVICKSHIGIMPLIDSEFAKGKGAFKLIQYLSAGLPVLGSAVGYNKEVITHNCGILVNDSNTISNWTDAVLSLSLDKNKWSKFSVDSLEIWYEKFSFFKNQEIWNMITQ